MGDLSLGILAPHPAGSEWELRRVEGSLPATTFNEDPVCGSATPGSYQLADPHRRTAQQLHHASRHQPGPGGLLTSPGDDTGTTWVGGPARTIIEGTVTL